MVGTSRQRQGHKPCRQKLSPFHSPCPCSHADKEQCTQHPRGKTHSLQKEVVPRQPLTSALPRDMCLLQSPIMYAVLGGEEAILEGMRAGGLWKMAVTTHWHDNYDPMSLCPGFGQDRVNFHRTPGRGTAEGWGLTPPGQTEPGIPYHVKSRWVPVGGEGAAGTHSRLGSAWRRSCPREQVCCASLCRIFSLFVSLLLLFPLFCCSVKLPLSRPTSVCLLLSILLRTLVGGGAAAWRFLLPAAAETKTQWHVQSQLLYTKRLSEVLQDYRIK